MVKNTGKFEANLGLSKGWQEAITGCEFVSHIAIPFNNSLPFEDIIDEALQEH